jgi:serine/threonine-protein kinase
VGADIADAIAAAHANGIIHRDLKPQNVFLSRRGRQQDVVKVLDFGIAKLAEAERADAPLTRTGQVFGTPMYMPPEQLRGAKDLDARADIYAIGAILYEALAGEPPYTAATFAELVLQIATEPLPSLRQRRPDVPPAFVALVEQALAKERERRPVSARALADALETFAVATAAPAASAVMVPASTPVAVPDPRIAGEDAPALERKRPVAAIGAAAIIVAAVAAIAISGVFGNGSVEGANRDAGVERSDPLVLDTRPAPPPPAAEPPPAEPPPEPAAVGTSSPALVGPFDAGLAAAPAAVEVRPGRRERPRPSPRPQAEPATTPRPTETPRPVETPRPAETPPPREEPREEPRAPRPPSLEPPPDLLPR